MKLGTSDFPKLQWSLLATVLMMIVGAAMVYFSYNATEVAKRDRAAAQAERNEFDGKLKQVRNEENEIKQKSAVFNALQTRGMIGEEQRLEWVELLKDIRDTRRLIDLQYEIAPQRRLDTDAAKGFAFYSSTMHLQLKLLHEEDLTRLIDDLREQARALIQVKSCDISRLSQGAGDGSPIAQLQADCRIDWITLRETKDAQETGQGK
ncbi:MAG: hypothetical protein KA150_13000 [Propionivibrio sp.]|nr:hypothetical protein [Propionivibrio sp.]